MSYTPERFIDLGRSFATSNRDDDPEKLAFESYASRELLKRKGNILDWETLLKKPLVVLLGEPGSGKSWELKHQADVAAQEGVYGFYIPLDDLISQPKLPLFDRARTDFERWIESEKEARFFLDSVDEAKVRKAEDFHRALDHFREAIGARHLKQARIVISSRITEWLPSADAAAVRERLCLPDPSEQTAKELPFVVHVLPLDESSVRKFVSARWGECGQGFLEAIEQASAWEFTRRPSDIEDLFGYWSARGSLGTLFEILEFVTDRQLEKASDRDRSQVLSLERARIGAEHLAAATVFCRCFRFSVPGENPESAGFLVAQQCLPADWRPEEVRSLLTCALFDGASYGCIRFHHRRRSEFLAARWVQRVMEADGMTSVLRDLFIADIGGRKILRPSLGAVAAWLCSGTESWSRELFSWILELEPELLLQFGDPARLTLWHRQRLLRALVDRVEIRERYWWATDRVILARLSQPDMEADIVALLDPNLFSAEVRDFAVELIAAGQLKGCAEALQRHTLFSLEETGNFQLGLNTLAQLGSDNLLRPITDRALALEILSPRAFGPLALKGYPRLWDTTDFITALSKVSPLTPNRFYGWSYSLRDHLSEVCRQTADGIPLLRGLLRMDAIPELEEEDIYDEPLPPLHFGVGVLKGTLERKNLSVEEEQFLGSALVQMLGSQRSPARFSDKLDWESLVGERPVIRRSFFWAASKAFPYRYGEPFVLLGSLQFHFDLLRPRLIDLDWILDDIRRTEDNLIREQACRWALELWEQYGKSSDVRRAIIRAIAPFSTLVQLARGTFSPSIKARIHTLWCRRFERYLRLSAWRFQLRKAKEYVWGIKATYSLWRYRKHIRSGRYCACLAQLVCEASDDNGRWTPTDWSTLAKKRGQRVLRDTRQGCKSTWRTYNPPLPSERQPEDHSVPNGIIVGLSGLMAEWQDGELDFTQLSPQDAERAVRYALGEMNDFPPWFPELVRAQPEAVQETLLSAIGRDFDTSIVADSGYRTISRVAMCGKITWPLLAEGIFRRLEAQAVYDFAVLGHALTIVSGSTHRDDKRLADLCSRRIEDTTQPTSILCSWAAFWLQIDGQAAVSWLIPYLNEENGRDIMECICDRLTGNEFGGPPVLSNPSWLNPNVARDFLPLIYKWVRIEEDEKHEPGIAYSIGRRDNAERFRGAAIEAFAASGDLAVPGVLESFTRNPDFAPISSYLGNLIARSCGTAAEGEPWIASDIPRFAREHTILPRTESDLFQITCSLLGELKHTVEHGENSPRKDALGDQSEDHLRSWFARQLEVLGKGRFAIPQEWQIADRTRPDLRITVPGMQPVSLEVKLLDKEHWTLAALLEGLESQLVGAYLRDHRARYGIYLLGLFDRKRRWRDTNGALIDADRVVTILRERARTLVEERSDVLGVEVVMIDFSEPANWRHPQPPPS